MLGKEKEEEKLKGRIYIFKDNKLFLYATNLFHLY